MANRTFDQYDLTILKRICTLWAQVQVTGTTPALQKWNYPQLNNSTVARTYSNAPSSGGGTGFPTRYAQGESGVFSVARTGTGLWTLTLQDNYQRVIGIRCDVSIAGGLSNIVACAENSTISNMSASGGSVVGLALLSSSATAADPTSGSLVRLRIELHDATEP